MVLARVLKLPLAKTMVVHIRFGVLEDCHWPPSSASLEFIAWVVALLLPHRQPLYKSFDQIYTIGAGTSTCTKSWKSCNVYTNGRKVSIPPSLIRFGCRTISKTAKLYRLFFLDFNRSMLLIQIPVLYCLTSLRFWSVPGSLDKFTQRFLPLY